nr:AAA family ATPase [Sphingomonas pokkalii]
MRRGCWRRRRGQLLSPWLREQESCLVWAAAGVGKTMFTLSLALAIAGGGSLMGWTSQRPRRVLLIDGEMPLDDLQERLRMLAGTIEGIDLGAAGTNLTVLARHGQSPDAIFPDFGKEEEQDANLALVRSYRPDVVILDNLTPPRSPARMRAASSPCCATCRLGWAAMPP